MVWNEKFLYDLISVYWASKYHCFHWRVKCPNWCGRDPTQPNNPLFAVNVYVELKNKSMAKVENKRKGQTEISEARCE